MKIKIKSVNSCTVCDENISVMVVKAPKRRYRQIIKAYYSIK